MAKTESPAETRQKTLRLYILLKSAILLDLSSKPKIFAVKHLWKTIAALKKFFSSIWIRFFVDGSAILKHD